MESLAGLKPVFPNWGEASTTAGNASGLGDGAALCVMTTRKTAEEKGWQIFGKWIGSAIVGMSDVANRCPGCRWNEYRRGA
jgi:acetyl-CoA acyltransferase 1